MDISLWWNNIDVTAVYKFVITHMHNIMLNSMDYYAILDNNHASVDISLGFLWTDIYMFIAFSKNTLQFP